VAAFARWDGSGGGVCEDEAVTHDLRRCDVKESAWAAGYNRADC